MSDQPYAQPPVQQPAQADPEPVQAGEPVVIQPADQAADGTSNETAGPVSETQPADSQPVDPPEGGPGEQSLAERQAGGEQVTADVPQPEAGPGAASPYAEPEAAYPAEAVDSTTPRGNATSNESPRLPGNLTSGAARAHAALGTAGDVAGNGEMSETDRISKLREIIDFALTELDRFLPNHVRGPARDEVAREL